jgi:Acetyltransferase (GNAT) domain
MTRAEVQLVADETASDGSVSPEMTIQMIQFDRRAEAERIWQSLESELDFVPLACSSTWTFTWLRHYGDVVPHCFALAEAGGRVRGIALLTEEERRRGPFALRRLHIGTAGEPPGEGVYVERNGLLAHTGDRRAVAAALMDALRRDDSWDELDLDGFRVDHAEPFLAAEPGLVSRPAISPCLDLRAGSGGVDGLLSLLRPKTRKRMRSNLRAIGPIESEWAEGPDQALEIFAELRALHQADWEARGERGVFASPRFTAFHRDLIAKLAPESVVLFRARATSSTIGCLYGLVDGEDFLSYQAGIARSDDNRLSLGLVAHVLCMAACADRGFHLYDLLAGEASYKRRLTTAEGTLLWARARRFRARLLELGRANGEV